MSRPFAELAAQFRFNQALLGAATAGFRDADWSYCAGQGGNPPHWILAHVAWSRRALLRRLGEELPKEPWETCVAMGSKPDQAGALPAPSELREDFARSGERIQARLGALSSEEGAKPWGFTFPDGSDTVGGGARFHYFHETYHLGQLGMLRRQLGHPGFA